MISLQELWQSKGYSYYPTDKGLQHSYLDAYTELFEEFQDEKINLIEIGIYLGGSIRLFEDWFTRATIRGYDVTLERLRVKPKRSEMIIKNCNDFSEDEFKEFPPHIIIDDGSHLLEDQLRTVEICYPQLEPGGMLIIEDIADIQNQKKEFDKLGIPYELRDLRLQKQRWDDVLLIFHK